MEHAHLSQPGQREIQSDLFYDYRANVASYPVRQDWLRQHQPPTLVLSGRYDPSFAVAGESTWQRSLAAADVHILDAGHSTLDEQVNASAALIRDFLAGLPSGGARGRG